VENQEQMKENSCQYNDRLTNSLIHSNHSTFVKHINSGNLRNAAQNLCYKFSLSVRIVLTNFFVKLCDTAAQAGRSLCG
jgi:hypothetical protein